MKEHPIIFSGPMVRAILEERKCQTRRIVKPVRGFEQHNICNPAMAADPWMVWWHGDVTDRVGCLQACPYGKPGDRLWVRESFRETGGAQMPDGKIASFSHRGHIVYRADADWDGPFRPSIHMPRWASRITLEVTGVRVERLWCITESDAKAEGFPIPEQAGNAGGMSANRHFEYYWKDLHGDDGWSANPFVWVISFRGACTHTQEGAR